MKMMTTGLKNQTHAKMNGSSFLRTRLQIFVQKHHPLTFDCSSALLKISKSTTETQATLVLCKKLCSASSDLFMINERKTTTKAALVLQTIYE